MRRLRLAALGLALLSLSCTRLDPREVTAAHPFFLPVAHDAPRADGSRLSVLWIGHATVLVQMDDKWILTDPWLVDTMGQIQRRVSPPGIEAKLLPPCDAVVISHLHPDHLSYGSLERIEHKVKRLFVPEGGLAYVPDLAFDAKELRTWDAFDDDGLRITAVPVRHVGGRYGIDAAWMTKSFTGYVITYHGMSVYFGGDTAYAPSDFRSTRARFPHLDLAILPIAPIRPRGHMRTLHMDPDEALDAMSDLGAAVMVPIHFDTMVAGHDWPGEARERLVTRSLARGLADRVDLLRIGERRTLISATAWQPRVQAASAPFRLGAVSALPPSQNAPVETDP
jgi:L-ascorbate metabolism protein UlaG (beta-lactamase superfamily)